MKEQLWIKKLALTQRTLFEKTENKIEDLKNQIGIVMQENNKEIVLMKKMVIIEFIQNNEKLNQINETITVQSNLCKKSIKAQGKVKKLMKKFNMSLTQVKELFKNKIEILMNTMKINDTK